MTWDMDSGLTSNLFDDMGVSMLDDDDNDAECKEMETATKPTPPNNPTQVLDPLVPPGVCLRICILCNITTRLNNVLLCQYY